MDICICWIEQAIGQWKCVCYSLLNKQARVGPTWFFKHLSSESGIGLQGRIGNGPINHQAANMRKADISPNINPIRNETNHLIT